MNYYIGIDGGGTKTAYVVMDDENNVVVSITTKGCSYKESSIDSVISTMECNIHKCIQQAGISKLLIKGIAIGLPCYGESSKEDSQIYSKIENMLSEIPFYLTNDVEVGWAGSLNTKDGINVVAGTGSIAFGKYNGKTARSGGWSTYFGDEGSCYWIGRKTMELFSKQADGRVLRGPLYSIIMEKFALDNDMDFIDVMEQEYVPHRDKVASLQKLLLLSAKEGDQSALDLYKEAAKELFLLVDGVKKQLNMPEKITVSYSGGLFHAKEFVLPQFEELVRTIGGRLVEPELNPVEGAVLLAKQVYKESR